MKCSVFIPNRTYSQPGPCQAKSDIRLVRWAPTPLKTKVLRLCSTHRHMLESGKLKIGGTKP